jgi:opine dehydrogenase
MTTVAVLGNTHRNPGAACAADLALAGHAVRYALFDPAPGSLDALRQDGGFHLQGDPSAYFSNRTGKAGLDAICASPPEALQGADMVVIDVPMPELEPRFAALLPHLPRDAVVHVQSHGYWAAARLTPILRRADREDVLVTDAVAPTHEASLEGNVLRGTRRRGLEVATVPGRRIHAVIDRLQSLFHDVTAAPTALQTGLESLNLMVHPAMLLLGIGLIERPDLRGGDPIRIFRECNVPTAGALAEALDAERGRVCAAYGVRHRTLPAAIDHFYGTSGSGVHEAILNCAAYQSFGPFPSRVWRDWEAVDVPFAIVPLVRLAEQAGIGAPLHRAVAEIFGALLGIRPWSCRPTLEDMALEGAGSTVARRFLIG